MAFFSGTANSPTDLKTLIETKAVLAGWTLTGGWLSKGISHVQLLAPDANFLNLTAANSADGLTQPTGVTRSICIQTLYWPVTYYLFINTNPDVIVMVVKYSTNKIQYMMFGNMVKIADAAYVGGNFYAATGDPNGLGTTYQSVNQKIDDSWLYEIALDHMTGQTTFWDGNIPAPIPFLDNIGNGNASGKGGILHAEIDGNIWSPSTNVAPKVTYTDTTISSLFRSPNLWDSQTHLVPMNLQYSMADGYFGYLGYIEHVRLVRVDNYEIGDIISISPDNWMVFPWRVKAMTARNGHLYPDTSTSGHSGSVGFAVRYTP